MDGSRIDRSALDQFIGLIGWNCWRRRVAEIRDQAASGPRTGRAVLGRHAICVAIERLRHGGAPTTAGELNLASLAAEAVELAADLPAVGRSRLVAGLRERMSGRDTL